MLSHEALDFLHRLYVLDELEVSSREAREDLCRRLTARWSFTGRALGGV